MRSWARSRLADCRRETENCSVDPNRRLNLIVADLNDADLSSARYNGDTKFPNGFDPKAEGMWLVPE
jgi:hypothetical protein